MALGRQPEASIEGDEESIFAEINITPLTDIFLLLMIIFIVSGSAAVEQMKKEQVDEKSSGLKINLPSGEAHEIDPGRKSLVVAVRKDGQIMVNKQLVREQDLDRLFLSAFTTDKNTQVVLQADAGVAHGRVVGVMEKAKKVGLSRLAIATKGGG